MQRARDTSLIDCFGSVLRQSRARAALTQEQLALEAGVDRTFVGLLESGKRQPTLSVIFALARALGVLPEQLVRMTREAVSGE
jgi:transcriptional regulator with XRE-family HTH domain